jgi:hypothetical protein
VESGKLKLSEFSNGLSDGEARDLLLADYPVEPTQVNRLRGTRQALYVLNNENAPTEDRAQAARALTMAFFSKEKNIQLSSNAFVNLLADHEGDAGELMDRIIEYASKPPLSAEDLRGTLTAAVTGMYLYRYGNRPLGSGTRLAESIESIGNYLGGKPSPAPAQASRIIENNISRDEEVDFRQLNPKTRPDLDTHLPGPDGLTNRGTLYGTHNLDNATAALDALGLPYVVKPTPTQGIFEVEYQYVNPNTGKVGSDIKTVYDPKVYSDATMLSYSVEAGKLGWQQFITNPQPRTYEVSYKGVNFKVYINFDKNGTPTVGNVHPIR